MSYIPWRDPYYEFPGVRHYIPSRYQVAAVAAGGVYGAARGLFKQYTNPHYWLYRGARRYLGGLQKRVDSIPKKDFRKRFVKSSHKKSVKWVNLVSKSKYPDWVNLVK